MKLLPGKYRYAEMDQENITKKISKADLSMLSGLDVGVEQEDGDS